MSKKTKRIQPWNDFNKNEYVPTIPNKYNLTFKDLSHFKVGDRTKIKKNPWWFNQSINAWCVYREVGPDMDSDSFWIGIYNEDAKSYKNKVRVLFSSYGGMTGYTFDKFYDVKEIENWMDYKIQEEALNVINKALDEGIIILDKEN